MNVANPFFAHSCDLADQPLANNEICRRFHLKQKKMAILRTENLVHEYSRRDEDGNVTEIIRAVDGVDMSVEQGQFIVILGANGSGKSTLAKHFNALLHPTEGAVYMDGKRTDDEENVLAIRQFVGMVFQNPDNQLVSNVVEEDVAFGPENLGVPVGELKNRVWESLKSVGMYEYRKHSPNHLSGGQKQRVAIAGILAMQSGCIILDEATAMLDPMGRKSVMEQAVRLNKEKNITIILITHHMEEAVNADKIFIMKKGKVVLSGTPREVFQKPKVLEQCKLVLPDATKIASELAKNGMPIRTDILTIEELESELGRMFS